LNGYSAIPIITHDTSLNKNLAIANRSRVIIAHNYYAIECIDNPVKLKSRLRLSALSVVWSPDLKRDIEAIEKDSKALYKKARWTKETILWPKIEIGKLAQP